MLSYQHMYHAGNWADVHKHWLLAETLETLKQKPKPLFYMETHAGRALYDLQSAESQKTQEAAHAITWARENDAIDPASAYGRCLAHTAQEYGLNSYPGSPKIAQHLLDDGDTLVLAELHPQEHDALTENMFRSGAHIHKKDGYQLMQSMMPPTPRRGLVMIDPSYEIKSEYADVPNAAKHAAKAWNVGNFLMWYPILTDHRQVEMVDQLHDLFPEGGAHEVRFAPAREGHRMIGSGMFYNRDIYGLRAVRAKISDFFAKLPHQP